jgi:hypothetical protein
VNRNSLIFAVVVMIAVLSMAGCTPTVKTEYPEYTVTDNDELGCAELTYNGITYRPFGVIGDGNLRGEQIGIREDDPESKVCEVKGYDSDKWIIEYLDVFMGGDIMLFKAVGVTEIPADLEQYKLYDF